MRSDKFFLVLLVSVLLLNSWILGAAPFPERLEELKQLEEAIGSGAIWNELPSSRIILPNEFQDDSESKVSIDMADLGPVQRNQLAWWEFLMSSLSLVPVNVRHLVAYHRDRLLNTQWHALVSPLAVNSQFSVLIRMAVTIGVGMHAVKIEEKPHFRTDLAAKIFTHVWAPHMHNWNPIFKFQPPNNKHGVIIFENDRERTICVSFRPYTDPPLIQSHELAFQADPDSFAASVNLIDEEDASVRVLNPIYREYMEMESEVLEFLRTFDKPSYRLITGGISAAGIYSQFFVIRASFDPDSVVGRFERKHVFAFNTPPAFHRDTDTAIVLRKIHTAGWEHSRVVTDDFCSVYWLGYPDTAEKVAEYHHLGPALAVSYNPAMKPPGAPFVNAISIRKEDDESYPNECFPHTDVPTHEHLVDVAQSNIRFQWIKLRHHVLDVGMSVTFIGEALKRKFRIDQSAFESLMWA